MALWPLAVQQMFPYLLTTQQGIELKFLNCLLHRLNGRNRGMEDEARLLVCQHRRQHEAEEMAYLEYCHASRLCATVRAAPPLYFSDADLWSTGFIRADGAVTVLFILPRSGALRAAVPSLRGVLG